MSSLRARVFASIVFVAVVASVLSAALAWTYVRNTEVEAERARSAEALVVQRVALDHLMSVGAESTEWVGLDAAVHAASTTVGARVVVLDRSDDTVIADSDPSGPVIGSSDVDAVVNPAFRLVAIVRSNGLIAEDATDACGGDCFEATAGFSPPVGLVVDQDASTPGLGFDLIGTIAAIAAVVAAAVLFAMVVSRRITRPIAALSASAVELGRGDLDQRFTSPKASREVSDLVVAFNEMAAGLQRSEAARSDLIADVSHELRNPVGTIVGNLEAVQDGVFEIDAAWIDRLLQEATHLSRLTDDLQQLALADAGALALDSEEVDVALLARDVVSSFAALAAEHGVTAQFEAIGPVVAEIDATRIRQVLVNLVKNAVTNTPRNGTVVVDVVRVDDTIVIHVADDGVGLTEDEQQRVFDRFWRADRSRTRATGGTGVGLSVSDTIIRSHGGTITVTSEPGVGSRFSVTIPAEVQQPG